MTNEDLKIWQVAMGYTQQQAADSLGIDRTTYRDMLAGIYRKSGKPAKIEKMAELACIALYADLKNWNDALAYIKFLNA